MSYRIVTLDNTPAGWPTIYDVHLSNGTVYDSMMASDLASFEAAAAKLGWERES